MELCAKVMDLEPGREILRKQRDFWSSAASTPKSSAASAAWSTFFTLASVSSVPLTSRSKSTLPRCSTPPTRWKMDVFSTSVMPSTSIACTSSSHCARAEGGGGGG